MIIFLEIFAGIALKHDKHDMASVGTDDMTQIRCLDKALNNEPRPLLLLYFYMRNLIGLEQWYFSLIWNTYMWKLQTFCG